MGEPTCLMQVQQPFSYVSGLPNEANEGNPIHALGQSISFGRFMSESLAWEKWSTFSHNRYVEEAERFSRPGSVAQKKAFFEAHYKNLAARKAAAAALLEQANAASENNAPEPEPESVITTQDSETTVSNSEVVVDEVGQQNLGVSGKGFRSNVEKMENFGSRKVEVTEMVTGHPVFVENGKGVEFSSHVLCVGNQNEVKETELTGLPKMEKSLTKPDQELSEPNSKKKTALSSSKVSTKSAAYSKPSTKSAALNATPMSKRNGVEPADKKRSTPKSLHKAVNFTPIRELNRLTSTVIRKIENSRAGVSSSKATKDCSTPLRTPNTGYNTGPSFGLCKQNSRTKMALAPYRRLEEKFNANEVQTEQLQTKVKDKPETETGKLRPSFCFKARPLPDFYKQRKAQKDEIKKVPATHPQSPKLRIKPTPTKVESRTSQTPNRPAVKTNGSKYVQGKVGRSPTCSLISRPTRMTTITHENRSPNIQQG
ncbi:TPX2, C-terminal [Trema orientale]|uniref:TPX2, C-terminal n=1 Tax=Trema orientale TaxID=63057 RepID=A0A2P5FBT6_TREOI|nr:TPX2, C-terminal [Trema orientale]